jgi:transposase
VVQLQVLLGAALERIGQLLTRLGQMKERNAQLEEENAQLRERLGQNSTNSSKPPSEDPPGTVRLHKKKKRRGRRPGGQPGHPKHERVLVPAEQVQRVVEVLPEHCKKCQRRLSGQDATPERHQVVELPPVAAQVTEYRCHQLECADCGTLTRARQCPEVAHRYGLVTRGRKPLHESGTFTRNGARDSDGRRSHGGSVARNFSASPTMSDVVRAAPNKRQF